MTTTPTGRARSPNAPFEASHHPPTGTLPPTSNGAAAPSDYSLVTSRYSLVLPCYNHGPQLAAYLPKILPFNLPIIITDDASNIGTSTLLDQLAAQHPQQITLLRHTTNQGKGAAVATAFRHALKQNFTHALQLDADGQHDPARIPDFLAASQKNPSAIISGQPIYDSSVPRARLYGRYITHLCVWLETLSFQIRDSMCGFRIYPLAPAVSLFNRHPVGTHMDFDTDIIVRLFRSGVPVQFISINVTYPANNLSNFRAFRDNLRISWMHTRLLLTLPLKIPALLTHRLRPKK